MRLTVSRFPLLSFQDIVRNELLDNVFAPLPATRTPLNAKVTGVHQDPRGFRVENVIFESRPNFFVTASLFVPDNATHNTPAVLFASGHWALSYRDLDDQQIVILNLVRKGIIVFAYDPPSQVRTALTTHKVYCLFVCLFLCCRASASCILTPQRICLLSVAAPTT